MMGRNDRSAGGPRGGPSGDENGTHGAGPAPDDAAHRDACGDAPDAEELSAATGAEISAELAAELAAVQAQAADHLASAQRVQAEFDNYRRRVDRERSEAASRAAERVVAGLLPALDDLERAVAHTVPTAETEGLIKGIEMVHGKIISVLGSEGAEVIDPLGQRFDPNDHQAVQQIENVDVPDHTVVDVFQKGYRIGGRVIRPAMVVVSTGGPEAPGD